MIRGNAERSAQFEDPQASAAPQADSAGPGLLVVLWRRRWIILASTLLCLGVAFAYLKQATPIYSSSSRLYIEEVGPRILTDNQGYVSQSGNYLNTQAEVLKSTPILAGAIELSDAVRMKTFAGVSNPVGLLRSMLSAQVGKDVDILTASVESPYPEEAARLVNCIVESYITYHSKQKRSTAAEVLKILQKEKDKQDGELERKLKAMLDFKQANGTLSLEFDKGNIIVQRLARLSDVLTQAEMETLTAKAVYEAAAAMNTDPAQRAQFLESQRARGLVLPAGRQDGEFRGALSQQELQLLLARQKFGDENPNVQSILLIIQELKRRIAQSEEQSGQQEKQYVANYVDTAHQTWVMAQQKEKEIAKAFAEQQKEAMDLNTTAAQFARLDADLKRTERLCDILDDRIKELNVTEDTGVLNINVLDVARAADAPSKPDRTRTMAMALALGLLLGVGLALLRDWMDQRLRSTDEIRAALDLAILGVIPHMRSNQLPQDRGRTVQLEPTSDVSEAYRTVRTALYFGASEGKGKTLLVTSPSPGDGKTTSASNLAIAMAQAGQRVLIVDADFRKPMQHRVFVAKNDIGLSSVLNGRGTLDNAIQHTAVGGLDLLPCGPIPHNPSEMLNSQAFIDALKELAGRYDQVVIDSPPVVPVTDARILGAICDMTLLVLRAEKSSRRISAHARDGLLSVGAQVLGVVVNDVSASQGGYSYYGYYGYRYGNAKPVAMAPGDHGNGNGKNGVAGDAHASPPFAGSNRS